MSTRKELQDKFLTGYFIDQADYTDWLENSAFLTDSVSAFPEIQQEFDFVNQSVSAIYTAPSSAFADIKQELDNVNQDISSIGQSIADVYTASVSAFTEIEQEFLDTNQLISDVYSAPVSAFYEIQQEFDLVNQSISAISVSGASSWNALTGKPNVVLTVNSVSADENGNVTTVQYKEIKYKRLGNLSAASGSEKIYIPYNINVNKFEIIVDKPNNNSVTLKIMRNGTLDDLGYLGTSVNERYQSDVVNLNLVAGDYLTVDWYDTTLAEDATLILTYTKI